MTAEADAAIYATLGSGIYSQIGPRRSSHDALERGVRHPAKGLTICQLLSPSTHP
jgi:hypothetical protein